MTLNALTGQPFDASQIEEQKNAAMQQIHGLGNNFSAKQMGQLEDWIDQFFNSYIEPDMNELIQEDPKLTDNTQVQSLLQNPEQLFEAPAYIDTVNLAIEPNSQMTYGQLTQDSKDQVNAFISDISKNLGVEVHVSVAAKEDGMSRMKLTAGTASGVSYSIPSRSVYSAHTHLSGILHPTPTDVRNDVPDAEDAVVVNGEGLVYA